MKKFLVGVLFLGFMFLVMVEVFGGFDCGWGNMLFEG